MENGFKEEDKEKVIEFLNLVANKAKFDGMTVQDNIDFFKLLSFMQSKLLPKIEDHILEVKKVHEPKEQPKKQNSKQGKE
jgi:hypothetical protein